MRVLVAISSCHKNRQRRDWQRQTWLPELQFDYKFFLGRGGMADPSEENVVILDCGDDYLSLVDKTFEEIKWARANGYDKLLKIDDDVYIRPERLIPPEQDYVGHCYSSGKFLYATGALMWLSAAAMDTLIANWIRHCKQDDVNIGLILHRHKFQMVDDRRYRIGWKSLPKDEGENEFPHPDNDAIAFHMYFPEFMPEMHENWDKRKQLVDAMNFNSLRNRY